MNYPNWTEPRHLDEWISTAKKYENVPGVYVLMTDGKPINRAFCEDVNGILYIGYSKNIRDRVRSIRTNNHQVTWYMKNNLNMANYFISPEIKKDRSNIRQYVEKLKVTVATVSDCKEKAKSMECSALLSYVHLYGETPPLNSALPKKWEFKSLKTKEIDWFKQIHLTSVSTGSSLRSSP